LSRYNSGWFCHNARASMISELTTCTRPCFKTPLHDLKHKTVCNNCHQLETDATFELSCNILACDVKCDGSCISGLVFVRGTLFDPAFGGLSGCYPTGQRITLFEVRWSP
jgi:hypothetical protein